jgi:hypothetical protein
VNLLHQRCFNHAQREAAARCPGCGRFFCRECVTEHQDRVICAACLRARTKLSFTRRAGFVLGLRLLQCVAGLLTAWLFFFLIGRLLVSLPDSFHEGTLWRSSLWDEPGRTSKAVEPVLRPVPGRHEGGGPPGSRGGSVRSSR